jgi:PTS system sucrose-specific IIC component
MTNKEIAQEILNIVGPASNVTHAANCMTRLRILVKTENFTKEDLQKTPGILGVNKQGEEWQIVLGPGKAGLVTTEFKELLTQQAACEEQERSMSNELKIQVGDGRALHAAFRQKNATPFKLFLKKIANIFMPLIPAFIGCGLITGILNVAVKYEPALSTEPLIQILGIAGRTVFWGLNMFVGLNAAKEFGGTPILGGVLGAVLAHPLLNKITFWGDPLVPGRGGIIAVLLVVAFAAWLEKKLHKIVPEMLDLFLTPLLVVVIAALAGVIVLQPIGGYISEGIGTAATVAISKGGPVTGFILGGTFLPLVMLGVHQGLTPIHAELLSRYGVTILLPILAMAGAGQVGAALAIYFKTKNRRVKKTIASALPVGIMGIGEPLIYGVTLPLGKPFLGACIGGALGGAVQAAGMVGASALGLSGLPLAASTDNIPVYLMGLGAGYAGGFIATWVLGFDDPEN